MEPIVIRPSRLRWALLLVTALVFVAAGVVMAASSEGVIVGVLSIVFFGLCALVAIQQLTDARPRVVIDDEGVLDRTLKVGRIAWSDIEGAYVRRMHANAFVCLELRDPAKYTAGLSPVMRRLAALNEKLGFTPLSLNLAHTDANPERVAELIEREVLRRRLESVEPPERVAAP